MMHVLTTSPKVSENDDATRLGDKAYELMTAGDGLVADVDREDRLKTYREGCAIYKKLATTDPSNTKWQHNLAASHNRIGNVQVEQGNLPAALSSYQATLAINDRLAKADPSIEWQHNLAVSHSNIGNVLLAEGARKAARDEYRKSLDITKKLVLLDPGNVERVRAFMYYFDQIDNIDREVIEVDSLADTDKVSYSKIMEAAKAIEAAADLLSTVYPRSDVRRALEDLAAKAERETASRSERVSLRPEVGTPAPVDGLQWPTKKWKDSDEKIRGKKRGIIIFLEREWEPFIQKTGQVVTRDILAMHDPEAEHAFKKYLDKHDFPKGISIIYPKQLEKIARERPELVRAALG